MAKEQTIQRLRSELDEERTECISETLRADRAEGALARFKDVSPEAILLGRLLSQRLEKLQRPHVHTYRRVTLGPGSQDFFDPKEEDLGEDKHGDQKYRHIIKDGCKITKIASRTIEPWGGTEIVYLFSGPGGESQFSIFLHGEGVKTTIADIPENEVPAWAWLQFNDRVTG